MNITIGRYIPVQSPLHRIDPRVKIFCLIALMVACFLPYNRVINVDGVDKEVTYWALSAAIYGVMFLICTILFLVGRLSFGKLFSSMKSLWFTVAILLVIYILVPNYTVPTLGIAFKVPAMNNWTVYWDSFAGAGRIFFRLVLTMMLTFLLTATTKPLELTYAFEWYLSPLKIVKFPSAEVAMTISIALTFIPTLLDDVNRISKAQASRGASFQKGGFRRKVVGLTSLIIPLFVSAFSRSEDLANAMICRSYDPKGKRTRYRAYRFHLIDLFAFLFCAALMALAITMIAIRFDPFLSWFGVSLL
ncbi:MAG: energy-coupling factor transporter transmembrane protein EcfT [Bacilli bacterium]|nr:energy-coupling factor transporter transmembrane protein EcfT [Bacilli bacterium]